MQKRLGKDERRRNERILSAVRRDRADAMWFLRRFSAKEPDAEAPLMKLIAMYASIDLNEPSPRVEDLEPSSAEHAFHLEASLARLASSVRILRDRNAFKQVRESFVSEEILGADTDQQDAERTVPGGIGTIVFAARLAQAGGGVIELMGRKSVNLDLRWTSPDGQVVLIERKDRSLEATGRDTAEKRALHACHNREENGLPIFSGCVSSLARRFSEFGRSH